MNNGMRLHGSATIKPKRMLFVLSSRQRASVPFTHIPVHPRPELSDLRVLNEFFNEFETAFFRTYPNQAEVQIVLGDRPVEVTLQRAWEALSFGERVNLAKSFGQLAFERAGMGGDSSRESEKGGLESESAAEKVGRSKMSYS